MNIPTVARPLFLLLSAETKMKIFLYDDTDGCGWRGRGVGGDMRERERKSSRGGRRKGIVVEVWAGEREEG